MIAGRPPELVDISIESEAPFVEGNPVQFAVTAIDTDPLVYSFDFNNDGVFDIESPDSQVSWSFPNEGEYDITVRVADQTGFVEDNISLSVLNAPPTLELNTGLNVGEGEDLTIFVTPRDPGIGDRIEVTVNFQDQTEIVSLVPNQTTRFSLPTQDNGFIDISAQATDDAGAESITYTARAFIENRPPFILPFSPTPAVEGEPYSQVIPADDPAGLNDLIFYSLIEPPANVEIETFSGLLLWTPSYDDYLQSPITFNLLIEDEDGGRLERSISIEVLPQDQDQDGLPDTYELESCEQYSPCLSPAQADDAQADFDEDGRTNYEEWEMGSDPFVYEGPNTPRQLSPGEDEVVNILPISLTVAHVNSDRPLLPNEDGLLSARELFLEYELYADEQRENLVEVSELLPLQSINDQETNTWVPNEENLIEDQFYWWRVRAHDGPATSSWSELRAFRVNSENRPPESPTLLLPLDGSSVADLTPTLSFNPSSDPDNETVFFVVRAYRESPQGLVVDFGGQVQIDGDGPLSFTPNSRLQENARYQWDVVAVDEVGLESEPSERWSFVVDLENEAPSEPSLISPQTGETVTERRPLFQAAGSIDQEGTEVSYHFQVRAVGDDTILAETELNGVFAEGGVAEWRANEDLLEDQEHVVSLYASDGVIQTGIITAQFYVSSEDNPPNTPTLLEPENDALVAPQDAVLIWSESRDPERGRVRYQVEYCSPEGDCQESEILSSNSFSLENLIPQKVVYSWRVKALDDADNTEGYSSSRYITLSVPSSSSDEGGCQQTGQRFPTTLVLIIGLWLFLRRELTFAS